MYWEIRVLSISRFEKGWVKKGFWKHEKKGVGDQKKDQGTGVGTGAVSN